MYVFNCINAASFGCRKNTLYNGQGERSSSQGGGSLTGHHGKGFKERKEGGSPSSIAV